MEKYHSEQSIEGLGLAWDYLDDDDLWIRHAARVALENQVLLNWSLAALTESNTKKALNALLALARVGDSNIKTQILARLNYIAWDSCSPEWQLIALRAYQLVFTLSLIHISEPTRPY